MKKFILTPFLLITPLLANAATTAYVTCYLSNGNWLWGLDENNKYYLARGEYKTSEFTSIQRFQLLTHKQPEDIYNACENSKKYYGETAPTVGVYAAASSTGSNYQILTLEHEELYPSGH